MLSKGILVISILFLVTTTAFAQQGVNGLSVVSNPAGAEVILSGDKIISGITPVNFIQALDGYYKVDIKKDGYETYKSSLLIRAGEPRSISVALRPKTRFKASTRSFFIPGWGQMYTNQKTKGGIFFIMTLGAVTSYLIADNDYNDKADIYDDYEDRYNAMTSFAEKEQFYPILADARNDAYDAETLRRITIGAAIAVWGLNFIDALFFFPERNGKLPANSISVVPDMEQGGGLVILSHRF